MRQYHQGTIPALKPDEVFVFGSNLGGRHGRGAALIARLHFGAQYGVDLGVTGKCYAIPTKDERMRTLPIERIAAYAADFCEHAAASPSVTFLLTAVGCGLAGYTPAQIAPLFANAPNNVIFPPNFAPSPSPSAPRPE